MLAVLIRSIVTAEEIHEPLLIEPSAARWAELAQSAPPAPSWVDRARFREQVGLARGSNGAGPIVLSGHQPGLWHCGIAAKYMALSAIASWAQTGWLIADLDECEATRVRIPVRDDRGVWAAKSLELAERDQGHPDAACGFRPATAIVNEVPEAAKLARLAMSESREGSRTLAEQAHRAAEFVFARAGVPLVSRVIRGSDTARTALFADLLRRMCDDPGSCVAAYNAAAETMPGAGVRALMCRPERGRFELPIWRVGWNEPRRPVIVEAGAKLECEGLAPRGLLMTGMLRLAGCDLFIHGTGGGVYDQVTEKWLTSWLGDEAVLSPAVVVSATRLLDLGVEPVAREQVQRAVGAAHRAWHDPSMVGDTGASARKQELVRAIEQAGRGSRERALKFAAMHALLSETNQSYRAELDAFEKRARLMREALASSVAAGDRIWSIALHASQTLNGLWEDVQASFDSAAIRRPPRAR